MTEKLKEISTNLLKQWNKYTSKQKTLIVSVLCVVVFALILLVVVLGRTEYEVLTVNEDTKQASEVVDLLESEGMNTNLILIK